MDSGDEKDNVCPICFEEKDDIRPFPHWESAGDISGHKMCTDCLSTYNKNVCPFCHEITLKDDILAVIRNFVNEIRSRSSDGDPNDMASMLEMWQFFEMEYGSNPKIIYRVAKLMIQDEDFASLLRDGVDNSSGWMRDAAGTIFRLHSLSLEGVLGIEDSERDLLEECYETIKQVTQEDEECDSGHFFGAVYNQALVPFICAKQSGQSTTQMRSIVKEIGELIVSIYEERQDERPGMKVEICERITPEYMSVATASVWGGKDNDPVWNAFFT